MSGIWSEFDPLGAARARPAAPVTSMAQVSAVPVLSPPKRRDGFDAHAEVHTAKTPAPDKHISTPAAASGSVEPNNLASSSKMTEVEEAPIEPHTNSETTTTRDNAESPLRDPPISKTPKREEPIREPPVVKPSVDPPASEEKAPNSQTRTGTAETSKEQAAASANADAGSATEIPNNQSEAYTEHTNLSGDLPTREPHIADLSDTSAVCSDEVEEKPREDPEPLSELTTASADTPAEPFPIEPKISLDTSKDDDDDDDDKEDSSRIADQPPRSGSPRAGSPPESPGKSSFDYQRFLADLRTKSAEPIARYIKSFLQEFQRGGVWTPAQQERVVADFMRFIKVKLRDFEPFKSMSKAGRRDAMEGVEKLVTTRLYNRLFPPVMAPILQTDGHQEDLLRDQIFEKKMRLWGWVEGRHLDINEQYLKSSFTKFAQSELSRVNQFKSPRDKLICLLNCSKVIFALIRQAQLEQNADSFLPLLIYVVLKCHPLHLVSTLNYIQRFRAREQLQGESAYYLSTLESAVTFITTLDRQNLTIADAEFEQRMNDACEAESVRVTEERHGEELRTAANGSSPHAHAHAQGESSAAVITASANMLVEQFKTFTTKVLSDMASDPSAQSGSGSGSGRQRRDAAQRFRDEQRIASEASREDYAVEQAARAKQRENAGALAGMFPSLDAEVISDVLQQTGEDVGSAVDICLALVSS